MPKMVNIAARILFIALFGFVSSHAFATEVFKVAAVEFNPVFKQREANFPAMEKAVARAAGQGAKLVLFPEMATTGYLFGSREEVAPFVDTVPGVTTQFFEKVARDHGVYIVVGMPEVDASTDLYYNSAIFVGPDEFIGHYRKNNLFLLESAWAAQGNLGNPVFETELGKISIIICYDDYFYQSVRVPALKGADLIAFIASSGRMLRPDPAMAGVHISIADVQQQALMNGVFVVATNRTNIERNSALDIGVHYLGGASVWDPTGKNLAQAPVSTQKGAAEEEGDPTILVAEVDPTRYDNPNKTLLKRRRPELYRSIILDMAPRPMNASTRSHNIHAVMVQYAPGEDLAKNKEAVSDLLSASATLSTNLIVLPELSLTGPARSPQHGRSLAGHAEETDEFFAAIARRHGSYVVYSKVVEDGGNYFKVATLLGPDGTAVGHYRKTHLDEAEATWLTAGDALPVFATEIGRIGLMMAGEARFPEAADVLSILRTDIIVISAAWTGKGARPDGLDKGFLVSPYPENTNVVWYATAENTQAYLLAANFVGTEEDYIGGSGLYSLDPVNGFYPPAVAPRDEAMGFSAALWTNAPSSWWTSQQYIIDGRRPELYVPLVLDEEGECFTRWQAGEVALATPCGQPPLSSSSPARADRSRRQ